MNRSSQPGEAEGPATATPQQAAPVSLGMQAVIKNKVKKSLLNAQHFHGQTRASAIPPKASYVPSPK